MKKSSLLALAAVTAMAAAQQGVSPTIKLVFTDTDAAQVLMAISMQSGQNIVYSNKAKDPISINLTAYSMEEAVRGVSAAAGLVYKRVGKVYVVAPKDGLRDALAPFAHTSYFQVDAASADAIAARVQDAIPSASVHSLGDQIAVTGVTEDVQNASEIIQEAIRAHKALKITSALVKMHEMSAEEVAPLIKGLYAGLTVTSTTGAKGAPPAPANGDTAPNFAPPPSLGAIGLTGPDALVQAAKVTLAELDETPTLDGPNRVVRRIYELKYVSAPSVQAFLKKMDPEIQTFVGPETLEVPRAPFNPLTQSITSAGSGGSTGGSGGGVSSGSGGTSGSSGGSQGTSQGGSQGSGTGVGGQAGATGGANVIGNRAKAVVLKGRIGDVEDAIKLISDLDIKPSQVVVEVNVLETSPALSEQIGMAYTFNQLSFFEVPPGTALTGGTGGTSINGLNSRNLGLGQITRTPFSFQAQLSALISNTNSKVLARPSLQIIDNGEGSVFIGNTVSVELQTSTGLGAQTTSIAQFPVGIKCAPNIIAASLIQKAG